MMDHNTVTKSRDIIGRGVLTRGRCLAARYDAVQRKRTGMRMEDLYAMLLRFTLRSSLAANRSLTRRTSNLPTAYLCTRTFTQTARMSDREIITAYPVGDFRHPRAQADAPQELTKIPGQEQKLPGRDIDMDPVANWTELEAWDDEGKPYLKEYVGSGKLKGKKAIITGGTSACLEQARLDR